VSEAAVAKTKNQPKGPKRKKADKSEASTVSKTSREKVAANVPAERGSALGSEAVSAQPPKTPEQIRAAKQALAMWALLGEGGEAYGGRLKPEIKKSEREALQQAGLIDVPPRTRAGYWLVVTERGWDWAEQHLADPLPANNGGALILQAWLTRLQGFLQARDLRLADLFAEQPGHFSKRPEARKALDPIEMRKRIRAAYHDLAGGFDRRVLLRDLRPKLADIDRPLLDAALMEMLRDQEASLMQLNFRPDVSDEDHAAALQIGNEPRHIIWISK
jgi:hypothetical protein